MPNCWFGIRHSSFGIDTLAPVASQSLPRIVEPACPDVVPCFGFAGAALDVQERFVDEAALPLLVVDRGVGEQAADDAAPSVDVLEQRLHVLPRAVLRTEVRQK